MLPLDSHAHIQPAIDPRDLRDLDACVVALTRTLDEYERVAGRRDHATVWGLGVHPGLPEAYESFQVARFLELLNGAQVVGEIGLDGQSKVPMGTQRRTLDAILAALAERPRLASLHSARATGAVLEAIEAKHSQGLVLHWWRGTQAETRRALDLGCYFSVNTAEVLNPKAIDLLPPDRVLTETDHPFGDHRQSPPRRPGRVGDVEAALAMRWGFDVNGVRRQIWANFCRLATNTATAAGLPATFQRTMLAA